MPFGKFTACGRITRLNSLCLSDHLEHARISRFACVQVIGSAKWIDCEWKAQPPLSATVAQIVDSSDGSIMETISVDENCYVNFTGLKLSFGKQYNVSVLNTATPLKLLGE